MAINPRWKTGRRRKYQQRFRSMQAPCGICGGRLGEIHYDEPSNSKHPLSFVIDEIIPISKWQEAGYASPAAAADDFSNLQAAHYICNQLKRDKVNFNLYSIKANTNMKPRKHIKTDGEW